ncbi:hypothetical protein [Natrinema amylolyticum]|uniref:hypothetical protein n=1 Tax=Natrinema amylolyticum TaxID=2878679 RepID=UPI001CFC3BA8|nr:hypothetical protein [Natrinema amylolyticum]
MTKTRLSESAEQVFIDDALLPDWEPAGAVGYDPSADPGNEAFVAIGESFEDVGETYPSITVQRTNETAPGGTGYNFVTTNGPGQDRSGQLLVTARAEAHGEGYTGDSSQYDPVDAEDLVDELINEVEDVCLRNATHTDTEFNGLGSYRGADAPNDYDATPSVMIEQCVVIYSWSRLP